MELINAAGLKGQDYINAVLYNTEVVNSKEHKEITENKKEAERIKKLLVNEEGKDRKFNMAKKYESQLFDMTDGELIEWYEIKKKK